MSRDMQLKVMMDKMIKLANAAHNAPDEGMKQIWTDKWYALVKQYAKQIEREKTFKENVKANERLND